MSLATINQTLHDQLKRISEPNITEEELQREAERSKLISMLSRDIISNSRLVLDAKKLQLEYGNTTPMPTLLALNDQ